MKRGGYTLMEVVVASAILMLAANIVVLGVSAASRMETRRQAFAEAGERVKGDSDRVPAALSLRISDSESGRPLTGAGYVCRESVGNGDSFVWSIWAELSLEDGQEGEE